MTAQPTGSPGNARTIRAAAAPATRFRCSCGRSVAAASGTAAADSHKCSRCRGRAARGADATLRRTA